MPEPTVAYRICPLCEACCGLTVEERWLEKAAVAASVAEVIDETS